MLCPECGQEMARVGRYWVCGRDGTTVPVARSESMVSGLPADHPDFALVESLPTPLAFSLFEFLTEQHPYIALHRLCDTAEIITRFFTIVVLSDLLRQYHGEFPEPVRIALTEKIERPTFGAWKELLRIACEYLPKRKGRRQCCVKELPEYVRNDWLPALGSGRTPYDKAVLSLRNFVVHSARLSHDEAERLLGAHRERFLSMVRGLSFLADYPLVACTKEGNLFWLRGVPAEGVFPKYTEPIDFTPQPERVYLLKGAEGLDVFPLQAFTEVMQIREERVERFDEVTPQVYFRVSERGYLEYVPFSGRVAFSQLKGSVYERFREVFRLEAWRAQRRREVEARGLWAEVNERIAELMEVFVGRDEHVRQVKERIKGTEQGVLWISGKPGVGKSALMAKLAQDYRGQPHFFTFAYFFRLGERGCSTGEFLESVLKALGVALGRTITPAAHLPDRQQQFVEAVRELVEGQGKKVLFLIDGLDEIGRKEQDFVHVPFMVQWPKVVWVCAGRPEPELERVLKERGAVWVFDEEGLPPLDETAIRAMLTEHLGRLKYALFRRDDEEGGNRFIRVVTRKSQGLPLYVRMVIDDLKAGRWTVDDEERLPEGLTAYFEDILERLRVSDVGTVLTPIFCLLAWAKEPLTEGMLKVLLRTHHLSRSSGWDALFRKAVEYGHMMLQLRPNSDGEVGLSFYHDAFRQHLLESAMVRENRIWAKERWLEVMAQWPELKKEGPDIYRYALRHYAEHLKEAKAWKKLIELARDEAFAQTQREVLPAEPDLPLQTLQLALLAGIEANRPTWMAEMVLRHAQWVETAETPLQALETHGLDRAIGLAKQRLERDYRIGTLWLLLLAFACKVKGDKKGAERCLQEVKHWWEGKFLEKIKREQIEIVKLLLSRSKGATSYIVAKLTQPRIVTLLLSELGDVTGAYEVAIKVVGDDKGRQELALRWAHRGNFEASVKFTEEIEDENTRADALRTLVKVMVKARMGEEAKKVFKAMVKVAEVIEDKWWRATALEAIANAMAEMKMFEEALTVAEKIEVFEWRAYALRAVANEMYKAGMVEEANKIFEETLKAAKKIEDAKSRARVLGEIAKGMVKSEIGKDANKTFEASLKVAESIDDKNERSWAWVDIIEAMAKAGVFEEALKVAGKIEVFEWRAYALRAVANEMYKAGMVEEANKIFEETLKAAKKIEDAKSRARVLGEIAEAMAKVNITEKAEEVFKAAIKVTDEINDAGERAQAFGDIAESMAKVGMFEGAIEVTERIEVVESREWAIKAVVEAMSEAGMFEGAIKIAEGIEDAWKRAETLNSVVKAMIEAGGGDDAFKVTKGIEDAWRAEVLSVVAEAMAKSGMGEKATKAFEIAVINATEFENEWTCAYALKAVVEAVVEAGMVEEAKKVLEIAIKVAEGIEDAEERAWALMSIVESMVVLGNLERAVKVAERIEDLEECTGALRLVAAAMARAGMLEKAKNVFEKALKVSEGIEDTEKRAWALMLIVEEMSNVAMFEAAVKVTEGINDVWLHANALSAVALAMVKSRRFDDAVKISERIEDECKRAYVLKAVAEAVVETEVVEKLKKVLETAVKLAEGIKDTKERAWALMSIVESMVVLGNFERAVKIVETIKAAGMYTWALRKIAESMAGAGMFGEAIKLSMEIDYDKELVETMGAVAAKMAKVGLGKEAKKIFEAMVKVAERIEDLEECTRALTLVAAAMARAGMLEKAKNVFEKAVIVSGGIEDTEKRAWTLMLIVEEMSNAAMFEAAVKVTEGINDVWLHANALSAVALAMVGKGRFYDAVKIVDGIEDIRERADILKSIVETMTKVGIVEGAVKVASKIEDANERAQAFKNIAEAMAKAGMKERAKIVMQEAMMAAKQLSEFSRMWEITQAAASSGLTELAVSFARSIVGERERLKDVLDALVESRAKDAVLQLLPLCGWMRATALHACACLIRLFPDDAKDLADIVTSFL